MGTTSKVYQMQYLTDQALSVITELPTLLHELTIELKNIQADLQEIDSCGYEPDRRLQITMNDYAAMLRKLHNKWEALDDILLETTDACGWTYQANSNNSIYILGDCAE
jgi:hypothetical protein